MSTRIGINGFGRMGRLALRAGWGRPDLSFVHVNEAVGGAVTAAHLLRFDSVHGRWPHAVEATDTSIVIDGMSIPFSSEPRPGAVDWASHGVDIVLECTGRFRTADGALAGVLGYEERPLVSVDFKDDPRSAIVDALSTMVVDGTCVKVLAWYDNEIGYVNRMVELAQKVGASL